MPLRTGTRLGPYEIQGPLGAGGMGEVYRAVDTRLHRPVAVKILPEHLSGDDRFRQRFDREAKVISNLSHPNICALFDVGSQEGVDFLVMEYLEGSTLADRLAGGRLSSDETLRLGIQIADALHAAHRVGVVHRDLKPGNIMLTRGGVKLLDFGLAKPLVRGTGALGPTVKLTDAEGDQPLTEKGSILGTVPYMAPEQLEGREADARTDIFSLGAVLYEMTTGVKAFEGDSKASLIAKIMSSEPPPMSELQHLTPPALERLVKACLAKDPDERIQTVYDVKLHLQWIAEGGSAAGMPSPVSSHRRLRFRLGWALAGLFFVISAFLTGRFLESRETSTPAIRASVILPPEGSFNLDAANTAISPDGTRLAFVAADSSGKRHLWIRPLASPDVEMLPGSEGAALPFWSPDSRQLGFFVAGKLLRISVSGERRVQVVCDAAGGRGGTWNREGTMLFCPASSGPLYRVASSGGQPVQVTSIDTTLGETAHRFPQFLPDGDHFIFVSIPAGPEGFPIRAASLSDPRPTTLVRAHSAAVFAPPGYLLFERDGSLLSQPVNPSKVQIQGEPTFLPDRPGYSTYNGSPMVSVSSNQVLAFFTPGMARNRLEWFDREGKSLGTVPVPPGAFHHPVLSPDGNRVALNGPEEEVWIVDLERSLSTRLTFGAEGGSPFPTWSPNGDRIYFASTTGDSRNVYWKSSSGAGRRELLAELPDVFNAPLDISPDGKTVLVRSLREATGEDLLLVSLNGDPEVRPYLESPFSEMDGAFSPDGRWIAYRSDESGRPEVYVRSFPDPTAKYRISINGSGDRHGRYRPRWAHGGRELIYVAGDGVTLISTAVTLGDTLKVGTTRVLFELPRNHSGFDIHGDRILVCDPRPGHLPPSLTVVTNWAARADAESR